jgi:hypothetical protein
MKTERITRKWQKSYPAIETCEPEFPQNSLFTFMSGHVSWQHFQSAMWNVAYTCNATALSRKMGSGQDEWLMLDFAKGRLNRSWEREREKTVRVLNSESKRLVSFTTVFFLNRSDFVLGECVESVTLSPNCVEARIPETIDVPADGPLTQWNPWAANGTTAPLRPDISFRAESTKGFPLSNPHDLYFNNNLKILSRVSVWP